jgi:hypothetical protein
LKHLQIKVVKTVLVSPKLSAWVAQKLSQADAPLGLVGLGWGLATAAPGGGPMNPKWDCWGRWAAMVYLDRDEFFGDPFQGAFAI